MSMFAMIFAQAAISDNVPTITVVPAVPRFAEGYVLPASAKAIVDHVGSLYKGDIDGALTFVAEDVENRVSDLKTNLHFPRGRPLTKAMYLAITRKGALPLSWFACRPEAELVRCDMHFGTGKKMRNFTLRYRAAGGPITQIYSWENHDRKKG